MSVGRGSDPARRGGTATVELSLHSLLADGWAWIVEAEATSGQESVLFAILFVHLWLALAIGRFGRARATSWVSLIVGLVVIGILSVLFEVVLPWGQVRFMLTAWADELPFGRDAARLTLAAVFEHGPADVGSAVAWGLLLSDMAVAYFGAWRGRGVRGVCWRVTAVIAVAIAVDIVATRATMPAPEPESAFTPVHVVPPWFDLPLYAVLRCIPDKVAGLVLALAVALVPALWPSVGRTARPPAFWPLWLAVAVAWVCLGAVGERMPDPPTVMAARVLAACWLAFFLLGPFTLRRRVV